MTTASNKLEQLSRRELEVFERIATGKPPALIAEELGLSVKTISTYRARILEKLDITSNAEIATLKAQDVLAVAADHTLLAGALVAGVAIWSFTDATDGTGEVCVDGLRHATRLDAHGVPALTAMLRRRLSAALSPQAN